MKYYVVFSDENGRAEAICTGLAHGSKLPANRYKPKSIPHNNYRFYIGTGNQEWDWEHDVVTENLVLVIREIKCAVTFQSSPEQVSKGYPDRKTTVEVPCREPVSKPECFKEEKFIFKGWFADPGLKTGFDFTAPIEKPTIVYAKWARKCVITYDANGGAWLGGDTACKRDLIEGDMLSPPPEDPKPPILGFPSLLAFWYREKDGRKDKYFGYSCPEPPLVTEDVTLCAMWVPDSLDAPYNNIQPAEQAPEAQDSLRTLPSYGEEKLNAIIQQSSSIKCKAWWYIYNKFRDEISTDLTTRVAMDSPIQVFLRKNDNIKADEPKIGALILLLRNLVSCCCFNKLLFEEKAIKCQEAIVAEFSGFIVPISKGTRSFLSPRSEADWQTVYKGLMSECFHDYFDDEKKKRNRCIGLLMLLAYLSVPTGSSSKSTYKFLCGDAFNVEHIRPKILEPDEPDEYENCLGNLMLLEIALNKKSDRESFGTKKEIYKKSNNTEAKQLSAREDDEWSVQQIEEFRAQRIDLLKEFFGCADFENEEAAKTPQQQPQQPPDPPCNAPDSAQSPAGPAPAAQPMRTHLL